MPVFSQGGSLTCQVSRPTCVSSHGRKVDREARDLQERVFFSQPQNSSVVNPLPTPFYALEGPKAQSRCNFQEALGGGTWPISSAAHCDSPHACWDQDGQAFASQPANCMTSGAYEWKDWLVIAAPTGHLRHAVRGGFELLK
jgi:hypothetical protein